MAKVKITGHASGTGVITVTAPNTSTDRTITLPDATATIATTTDVAARLPSIVDGGNATAMTIDSSENVGIGTSSPRQNLEVINNTDTSSDTDILGVGSVYGNGGHKGIVWRDSNQVLGRLSCQYVASRTDVDMVFSSLYNSGAQASSVESLRLTGDGRGLSQFTALAWCDYTGTGINDTFNVSSVSDGGTGQYTFSFSNNMANDTYAVVASTCKGGGSPSASNSSAVSVGETRAVGSCLIEVFRADLVTRRDGTVRMAIFGDV